MWRLPIVKDFVKTGRGGRALGEEVHKALRPSEQVVKIIHEELVEMLGDARQAELQPAA